jgi:cytochrome P450
MAGAPAYDVGRMTTDRGQTPPGPRGSPFVGAGLALRRDLLGSFRRAREEHGDVVRFRAGPPGLRATLYAAFHPDAVRHVLAAEADSYRKDNVFYDEIRWAFGDGLLNSQDERWRRQRRFVQPLFTRRRIDGYAATMASEAAEQVERWRPSAAEGWEVDLHAEMQRLTLRVVGRILFGADLERAAPVVSRALPVLGAHALRRAFLPMRPPRGWPTRSNRRAERARSAVYSLCDELVADRRARPAGEDDDLLGLLVGARDDGQALDPAEVRDQAFIFLLAGQDTTAIALTFALHLLGSHPQEQERVRAEAGSVLGDRLPTASDVEELRHTGMVLREAMRLYPPVYAFGRRATRDDRIGPYAIPAGADVYLSPWVTHRHPAAWSDPDAFLPERFAPEREAERHRHAYFPFGAGPRACIGQHFAMLEAVIALAVIVRDVELATPAGPVPVVPRITLHPAGPVPCRLGLRTGGPVGARRRAVEA